MDRIWTMRDYRPGDENGILQLWRDAFPEGEMERTSPDYWHWQFMAPPAGKGKIKLAVDGDKIVGQYAVIPVAMQMMGDQMVGSLSLDTMTHPDYQRLGIFKTLANQVYMELGQEDIPLTYGFPNENSLNGFVKYLGWAHISTLTFLFKPLRGDRLLSSVFPKFLSRLLSPFAFKAGNLLFRIKPQSDNSKKKTRWIEHFDERAELIWRQVYDSTKIALTRNHDFLNWRYIHNPSRDYLAIGYYERDSLLAYTVFRLMTQFGLKGGMITELMGLPGRIDALENVLTAACRYIYAQGADLAACMVIGDPRVTKLLRRNQFLNIPKKFGFKRWYFGGRVNNDQINEDVLKNSENWYLTFGDTDVI